jgi:uncharacterized protein (DUF2062 family)
MVGDGMGNVKEALRRHVAAPVIQQLKQGATPEKLALSLALGVVVSVMPILGITTLFALAFSAALRLNHAAVVAANYAAYPLQIVLYVPFFQLGAWITRGPPVPFSLAQVKAEMAAGVWATVVKYAEANARAMAAWILVAPLATWLLYLLLRPLLSRIPIPGAGAAPKGPDAA